MTDKEALETLLCLVFGRKDDRKTIDVPPEKAAMLVQKLKEVLNTLTYRERETIKLRYGIGDSGEVFPIKEVAEMLKLTRERIRQIEAKAIRKLHHPARTRKIEEAMAALNL